LHFLIENCTRLVSKDELFGAVWPDLTVTDDALVQSIGELRRALGADGARLIRTIPRRGYRFESDVSVGSVGQSLVGDPSVSTAFNDTVEMPEPVTVGRRPFAFLTTAGAGWRLGLLASLALAVVIAAAVATGWNSQTALSGADRSAPKGPKIGTKPAIAVLPFLNESPDPGRQYFADGLTQDIINALGRFSELTVMSWNAVLPYRSKSANPAEITRSLAVRYQVEGSVRQIGDRVRVSIQLVDVEGRVLWSDRFVRRSPTFSACKVGSPHRSPARCRSE
jgi:TolB-like protein